MLVVNIELWSAVTGRKTLIGRSIIHNVGGTHERGDYKICVGRKDKLDLHDVFNEPLRQGDVKMYPRLSYNVWRLVIRALRSAFPEEK